MAGVSAANRPLPAGWRWVKLDEACQRNTGQRDPRAQPDRPFQYVDISSVDNAAKRIVEARVLIGRDAPSRARQVVRSGDVVVATTRPNLNAVALIPPDLDDQICSTGFCVLRPLEGLLPEYLFAYVQSREFVNALSGLVVGALYPAVTDRQVREQPLPLPPLPEQRRIAAVLTERMAAIDRARAAAETQLEAAKALPAAYLRQVFPRPSRPLLASWRWVKLGGVCDFIRGVTFDKTEAKALPVPGHLPILRAGNIGNTLDLTHDLVWVPPERVAPEQRLRSGDIAVCMSSGSPTVVGKTAQAKQAWEGSVGAFCGIIRARHPDSADYVALWLRSPDFIAWRNGQARGANIQNLRFSQFEDIEFPFPPLPEQRRIAAILTDRMATIDRVHRVIQQQIDLISTLPAALLRQAFNGEL